jgi:hypothetical protein
MFSMVSRVQEQAGLQANAPQSIVFYSPENGRVIRSAYNSPYAASRFSMYTQITQITGQYSGRDEEVAGPGCGLRRIAHNEEGISTDVDRIVVCHTAVG